MQSGVHQENKEPQKNSNEIEFSKFISEVTEDSGRARKLVTILLISTVLVFIAWINSLDEDFNWLKSRMSSEENAYPYLIFPEEPSDTLILADNHKIPNRFSWYAFQDSVQKYYYLSHDLIAHQSTISNFELKIPNYLLQEVTQHNQHQTNGGARNLTRYFKLDTNITNDEIDRVKEVIKVLKFRNYSSRTEVNRKIFGLQNDILETTQQIRIPIIGLSFDVNLLCIFSGLFFSVIYFLLFHARARERKNLTLVFELSSSKNINHDKTRLYQFLTMQQVLTIPPSIDEFLVNQGYGLHDVKRIITKTKFKKLKVLVPVLAPMLMWLICFVYDIVSAIYGFYLNSVMTYLHFGFAGIVGIVCYYGFINCYREWVTIEELWEKEALKAICQHRNWPNINEQTEKS